MKTNIKKGFIWLGLSILMMVFWIIGLYSGNLIFPSDLMEMEAETNTGGEWLFFLVCITNTWIILYFIYNSRYKGWSLTGIVFIVGFAIQFFMSQIETIWFNDSLKLSMNGIWAIITGGAVLHLLFSPTAVWLTGNFKQSRENDKKHFIFDPLTTIKKTILLSVLVWPLIYFLAGYFIAWQFPEVRMFYTGTTDLTSFYSIMKENVISGLFFFSILRGVIWVLIALLVLHGTLGSPLKKGILLGLLFAILGSSGLLIPNPIMPFMVRMAHLVETAPSSFLWGFIIAWFFSEYGTLTLTPKAK
jgi:hypothetical protein